MIPGRSGLQFSSHAAETQSVPVSLTNEHEQEQEQIIVAPFTVEQSTNTWHAHSRDVIEYIVSELKTRLVVIKCGATWCRPCVESAPMFDNLAREYEDVSNIAFAVLDVDKNDQFANLLSAVPAYLIIVDGELLGNDSGKPDVLFGADLAPVKEKINNIVDHINSSTPL